MTNQQSWFELKTMTALICHLIYVASSKFEMIVINDLSKFHDLQLIIITMITDYDDGDDDEL